MEYTPDTSSETGPIPPQTEIDAIPDKFGGDVNKLAEAYKELEQKLSGGQEPAPTAEIPTPETTETTEEPKSLQIEEPTTPEGEDLFAAFAQKYTEAGGQLEQSEIDGFAKQTGIPQQYIQDFLEGQALRAQAREQQIMQSVGGAQEYGKAVEWAQSNLSPAEIQAFNSSVSGSVEGATLAVQGLMARYQGAVGSTPTLVKGQGSNVSEPAYTHMDQALMDMKDPRYAVDESFRQSVARKMRNL